MSNLNAKRGEYLAIWIARELCELTGETPSCLFAWAEHQKISPAPFGARQTFYSHLSLWWEPSNVRTLTQDCHLGSYPFGCELRFRAVSVWTQFSRDVKARKKRQVIIFFGYEICSQLLHFRVYRGPVYTEIDGVFICEELPFLAVKSFVDECAHMVGLPLKRVLFTQPVKNLPIPKDDQVGYLPLTSAPPRIADKSNGEGPNEVLYGFANLPGQALKPFSTVQGDHPFSKWCETTSVTALTDRLSEMVKRHNKANSIPRLAKGLNAFEVVLKKSHLENQKKFASSIWPAPAFTPFLKRMAKHDYVLQSFSLHDTQFYKRQYEDFDSYPGDRSPVERRHGDSGDSDTAE